MTGALSPAAASPGLPLETVAVVLEQPCELALKRLALTPPGPTDVVVDLAWTGISTGTERLLFRGEMPPFPGMGYPLVPGYESVGRVVEAGSGSGRERGQWVFVPGARCFEGVRGLFGGAARRLVVAGDRAWPVPDGLGEQAVLLALAATAQHALAGGPPPELIVGHGVLGRLLARQAILHGAAPPTVWEADAGRRSGASGYRVVDPRHDERRDYRAIYDVSGDASLLDELLARIAPGGEVVLAGFYPGRLSFDFAPAFMREARLRIAAEWNDEDLAAVLELVASGRLPLDGLVTHRAPAADAPAAYERAFGDPSCLKMILDWRDEA